MAHNEFIKFVAAGFAVIFINGHDIPPYYPELVSSMYKKDKIGPGASQVMKNCKDGEFSIAECWRSLRLEKIKKAKPKLA